MRSYTLTLLCQVSGIASICLDRWVFHHDGEMFALGIAMLIGSLLCLPPLGDDKKT